MKSSGHQKHGGVYRRKIQTFMIYDESDKCYLNHSSGRLREIPEGNSEEAEQGRLCLVRL